MATCVMYRTIADKYIFAKNKMVSSANPRSGTKPTGFLLLLFAAESRIQSAQKSQTGI